MANRKLHPLEREALRLGLTRQEIADALQCTPQYISMIYHGQRRGTDPFKKRMMRWSGGNITAADLLTWEPGKR